MADKTPPGSIPASDSREIAKQLPDHYFSIQGLGFKSESTGRGIWVTAIIAVAVAGTGLVLALYGLSWPLSPAPGSATPLLP